MSYRTIISMPHGDAKPTVKVEPQLAIIVSRIISRCATGGFSDLPPVLSQHTIEQSGGTSVIGPGEVVTAASLIGMMGDFGFKLPMQWCDESLLALGQDGFVWHQPSRIAPMYWLVNNKPVVLRARWPHLVFSVTAKGFRTFAHVGTTRPKPSDALYLPPLGNIYEDGRLCWGNVQKPAFSAEFRGAYEDAIYKSNFTHANGDVLSPKAKSPKSGLGRPDLFAYWRGLSGSRPRAVPNEHLASTKLKVRDLL